jgi:hypothetical protein
MHNSFFSDFEDLELNLKNINKYTRFNIIETKKKIDNKPKNIINKNNIFYPTEDDSLFWCFYICKHSLDNYINFIEKMNTNKFVYEKKEKINIIEECRNNKVVFKNLKISRNTVEDDLLNEKKISIKTFQVLCHLYDINVYMIDNKKYFPIITNETKPIHLIEIKKENKQIYGVIENLSQEKIKYYQEYYWKLENLDKPLKAISNYKSADLKDICSKMNITCEKLTKPQMYELILNNLA